MTTPQPTETANIPGYETWYQPANDTHWVRLVAESIVVAAHDGPFVNPTIVDDSRRLLAADPAWCHQVLRRVPSQSLFGAWPALERHEPYMLVLADRARRQIAAV